MFLDTAVNSNNAADYRLQAAEHPYATDVEWDPTGRYVVTYVSAWIRNGDNEYQVWSFLGRRLRKETKVRLIVFDDFSGTNRFYLSFSCQNWSNLYGAHECPRCSPTRT